MGLRSTKRFHRHLHTQRHAARYTFSSNAGVCEMTPREAPDCRFREAKPLGNTSLSPVEVQRAIDRLRTSWTGDTYDVRAVHRVVY